MTAKHGVQPAAGIVNVADFGACPIDGTNTAAALRRAVTACRESVANRLIIPPGQYLIEDETALKLQEDALHGRLGNSQDQIYNRSHQYVVGPDFEGIKDLVVDAKDAELLISGWMEPVNISRAENVTINGLSIDFKRPPNSCGEIVRVENGYAHVKFFDWCPVGDGISFMRTMIYDPVDEVYVSRGELRGNPERVAPQTLRYEVVGELRPGDVAAVVAIHVNAEKRDVPGLHKRILIENNVISHPGSDHIFSVKGAEDVTIRKNTIKDTVRVPLVVAASRRVKAYDNEGMADYSTDDGEPSLPEDAPDTTFPER